MSGPMAILAFVVAVIVMIVAISRWKIHPFLAILAVSLVFGVVAGVPLVDQKGPDGKLAAAGIATVIGQGFSGTFTSIGIVIIFGALIGAALEKSGAAFKLADMVIRLVGQKRPETAVQMMGWVVSIPVFCDSGFVILNPIRKALIQRTAASSVMLTMALSGGLYISHVFIPPTPGPIAAANTLGVGDNLLLVIGMGVLVSIFPMIVLNFAARWIGRRERAGDEVNPDEIVATYEEIVAAYGRIPSGWRTLAPIVVPILLMALGSIANAMQWSGVAREMAVFFGTPIIALAVGVIFAILALADVNKLGDFASLTDDTLKTVGPILFITAAGGVLGKVIASTSIVPYITAHGETLKGLGIVFPFLLAAILKTAQGSSTVALTTTAGILAPLLGVLGMDTPVLATLCVMAIGAGAMTVSHANDSYFWVVTRFGQIDATQGYRTQTLMTLILGLASIAWIFVLWLFFK